MAFQKTISSSFEITGTTLHSGRHASLSFSSAPTDTGIVFRRNDGTHLHEIPARWSNINSTKLSTSLKSCEASISTVEHIMAALFLAEVDNIFIDINGPEVPIIDGSASMFYSKIRRHGLSEQPEARKHIVIDKLFEFRLDDQLIKVEPARYFTAECKISFANRIIGTQTAKFDGSEISKKRISAARTFCHLQDVNNMRKNGLALGGSLENAIVVSDNGIVNDDGLRSSNEFAEHKLLDLLGDIYLLGAPIIGKISAYKPGHSLHAAFMEEFMKEFNSFAHWSSTKGGKQVLDSVPVDSNYAYG